ncbi:MAG: hypothetical protein V4509_01675 [Patescibacteria group bacterium]
MHDITKENWYYTQVFGENGHYYTITFAKDMTEAKELINKWLDFHKVGERRDIHLYLKNYKRGARQAVARGQFIDVNTLDTATHHITT